MVKETIMSFFEKNLKALTSADFPGKYEIIKKLRSEVPLERVETSVQDCPTAFGFDGIRKVALHSTRNPVKEAERWIATNKLDEHNHLVALGIALGYHVEAALNLYHSESRIIVVELNLKHFATALHARDLSTILDNDRIKLFLGPMDIIRNEFISETEYLKENDGVEVEVMIHEPSLRTLPKSEQQSQEIFYYIRNIRISTKNTRQQRLQQKNQAGNEEVVKASVSVETLRGSQLGRTAILIAPGPSLQKNLHLVALAAGHAVTVCLDAALKPAVNAGLVPDYVVTIDPADIISDFFDFSFSNKTGLIFFPGSNMKAVRRFAPENRFVAMPSDIPPPSGRERGFEGMLYRSSSVIITALDFYRHIGCNSIILVGADHAVRKDRSHVEGAATQSRKSSRLIKAGGYFGVEVNVPEDYYIYLREIETFFEKYFPGCQLINATEGGSRINGCRQSSFLDAVVNIL